MKHTVIDANYCVYKHVYTFVAWRYSHNKKMAKIISFETYLANAAPAGCGYVSK